MRFYVLFDGFCFEFEYKLNSCCIQEMNFLSLIVEVMIKLFNTNDTICNGAK